MRHIKETNDTEYNIESEPLTDKAKEEISAFIKNYRSKDAPDKPALSIQKNPKIDSRKAAV
ncbi:hypothetical protein [Dyadobacter pollutisoli]|uniref:Uncharacterized protein n=1 Tax=Dyadobacter pollutisoli TaxID=2910158 RepID=A0A9E8SRV2_9BACT|nr:hypothetical protein [Dyadobacter pollutisoli]WAC14612.1 hypothetical protein ON006_11750 [Dyadobacter pollutisoli]